MPPSLDVHSPTGFQYIETPNGTNTELRNTSRAIRVGGAGDIYIRPYGQPSGEVLFASNVQVGEILYIQTDFITTSTDATKLTVYLNDN